MFNSSLWKKGWREGREEEERRRAKNYVPKRERESRKLVKRTIQHSTRGWSLKGATIRISNVPCFPLPGLNRSVPLFVDRYFHLKRITFSVASRWRRQPCFPLAWLMPLHIFWLVRGTVPGQNRLSSAVRKSRTERNLRKGFPANVTCLPDTRTSRDAFKFDRFAFVSRISSSLGHDPRICYVALNLGDSILGKNIIYIIFFSRRIVRSFLRSTFVQFSIILWKIPQML